MMPSWPGGPWLARESTNIPPGPVPGIWGCATSTSSGGLLGGSGALRRRGPPRTPEHRSRDGVDFNPEHVLDVTDLAGNPINQWYIVTWTVVTA